MPSITNFFLEKLKWDIKIKKQIVALAQGVPRKTTTVLQRYQYKSHQNTNISRCPNKAMSSTTSNDNL
jgi:hypothetical protein